MTPNTDDVLLNGLQETEEQTSKTYCINIEKNIISGYCDGIEAMKQAIYCILNTERFENLIYSWNYGIETNHLIGESTTFVIPEIERLITEALMQDTRISEVTDFQFETKKNQVVVKFTVITIVGEVKAEKVVNV